MLSSYAGGWYFCNGYDERLKHFGMQTVSTAPYVPANFRRNSSVSHLVSGTIDDVDKVYVHPKLEYNGIQVRVWNWPPGSDGELITFTTSPVYNPPSDEVLKKMRRKYGKLEYEKLLQADGWMWISSLEFHKTALMKHIQYDSIKGLNYYANKQ